MKLSSKNPLIQTSAYLHFWQVSLYQIYNIHIKMTMFSVAKLKVRRSQVFDIIWTNIGWRSRRVVAIKTIMLIIFIYLIINVLQTDIRSPMNENNPQRAFKTINTFTDENTFLKGHKCVKNTKEPNDSDVSVYFCLCFCRLGEFPFGTECESWPFR